MSASVHFRGRSNVLQAFQERKVEMWSLFQGKQFLSKGEGEEELNSFLMMLEGSLSVSVYTIKIYEDITDIKKLKSNTPDDGSFNFRLREPDTYAGGAPGAFTPSQGWQEMSARLDRMDSQWEAFLERFGNNDEEEEEEEGGGLVGALTGLLSDPEKLEKLIQVGKSLLGGGAVASPAYVGNVNRLETASLSPSAPQVQDQTALIQRLSSAINTLEVHDSKLVEHLEKLASIAVTQPTQFKTLISMIDVF